MNIQQLRYVVAIANSGTFREAASKLFVSQPSLSVAIKDLEQELNFQIFTRTTTGAVLTSQGMTFYERALEVVRSFDSFENRYLNASEKGNQFSIASQHYDFLPPLITTFSERYPDYKDFRIFESTTIQILDEVAKGHSEIGIIYLNRQNSKGIQQNIDKLGLEAIDLIPFKSHIYLRKGHPLAKKDSLVMDDLVTLPTVRFTQEKDEYLYYSENFVDTTDSSLIFNVTDRATLNGILELGISWRIVFNHCLCCATRGDTMFSPRHRSKEGYSVSSSPCSVPKGSSFVFSMFSSGIWASPFG